MTVTITLPGFCEHASYHLAAVEDFLPPGGGSVERYVAERLAEGYNARILLAIEYCRICGQDWTIQR